MSRNFLGFGQKQYIGTPFTRAVKLGGISAQVIPLLFQWISYGASTSNPNINVLVSFDNALCRALDQVRSIYIDNLGSDNPVYVFFPDTGLTLVAKPNSEGWYPAFTNSKTIWVMGEGFLTGDIPQTFILVSNVPMIPAINSEIDNAVALWRASPTITRGNSIYNSALGIPALGDQTVQYIFNFGSTGVSTNNLWGSPYPSGFLYITMIDFYLTGSVSNLNNVGSTSILVESIGISGTLFNLTYSFETIAEGFTGINSRDKGSSRLLGPLSGMNLKLDATQTWRIRIGSINNGFNSTYSFNSNFTQQP